MAFDAHKNLAIGTVGTAPSPASSGTTLTVGSGEGARFPAAPFNATVWPANALSTPANAEIVRVTNKGSGDDWTITRTQESTSARAITSGDYIAATITAKTLTDIEAGTNFTNLGGSGTLAMTGLGTHSFNATGVGANVVAVRQSTAGAANFAEMRIGADTAADTFFVDVYSSTYTPSGPALANGVSMGAQGAGGFSIGAFHASGALRFYAGGVSESMRLDTSGNLVLGTTSSNHPFRINRSKAYASAAGWLASLENTHASDPAGLHLHFTAAAPNGTGNEFILAEDSSATRFTVRSNGGIANYQANDVNLSDARTKHVTGPAPAERERFRRLAFVRARYRDSAQADDVMVTAQQVRDVYPELVTLYDPARRLLGVREHGLVMRAMQVIQELDTALEAAMARIATLEARTGIV